MPNFPHMLNVEDQVGLGRQPVFLGTTVSTTANGILNVYLERLERQPIQLRS